METIGHGDVFDSKALGENLSDLDDFLEASNAGMRGFYGGRTEQDVFPSTGESSQSDEADSSSPDYPEGDLPNGLA